MFAMHQRLISAPGPSCRPCAHSARGLRCQGAGSNGSLGGAPKQAALHNFQRNRDDRSNMEEGFRPLNRLIWEVCHCFFSHFLPLTPNPLLPSLCLFSSFHPPGASLPPLSVASSAPNSLPHLHCLLSSPFVTPSLPLYSPPPVLSLPFPSALHFASPSTSWCQPPKHRPLIPQHCPGD